MIGDAGGAVGMRVGKECPIPPEGVWAGCCTPPRIFCLNFWFKMGFFFFKKFSVQEKGSITQFP